MHPQLSHRMAQLSQRDLHEAGERARSTHASSGETWFRGFSWKLGGTRGNDQADAQTPPPVRRIAAA